MKIPAGLIQHGFRLLGEKLAARGVVADIYVFSDGASDQSPTVRFAYRTPLLLAGFSSSTPSAVLMAYLTAGMVPSPCAGALIGSSKTPSAGICWNVHFIGLVGEADIAPTIHETHTDKTLTVSVYDSKQLVGDVEAGDYQGFKKLRDITFDLP